MAQKDFVVSADGHLLEPIDLFKTRLPENLRRVPRGARTQETVGLPVPATEPEAARVGG